MRQVWISLLLLLTCRSFAQDSLKAAYNTAATPAERVLIAIKIAGQNLHRSPPTAYLYIRKGLSETGILPAPNARLHMNLGIYYAERGNYDSAYIAYRKAEQFARLANDQSLVNRVFSNLGLMYYFKGEYSKALEYMLHQLEVYEREKDAIAVRQTIIDIGSTYHFKGDYKKAGEYFDRAFRTLKDSINRPAAALYNSMGLNYMDMGEVEKGKKFLLRSLFIKQKLEDSLGMSNTYLNLGHLELGRKKYDDAAAYLHIALRIAEKINNEKNKRLVMENLASVAAGRKDGDSAIVLFRQALLKGKAENDMLVQRTALENLAKLCEGKGDYQHAYEYLQQHQSLLFTIADTDFNHQLAAAEVKYETQKKQRENMQLQYENRLKTIAKNKAESDKKLVLYIAVISLLLLSGFLLFLYRYKRWKAGVKEEQSLTQAIFDGEQKERIRIARDLHDSIGQMLSVVKMQVSGLHYSATEADKKVTSGTLELVDKTISEVRNISHNLIPEELNFGIIKAIEDMCYKINSAGGVQVIFTAADDIKEQQFSKTLALSLYRIVQEVLGNMLKHANATEINIGFYKKQQSVIIQLRDNGKGFDTGKIADSMGLGWKNIFARVNLLNGKMNIQSERITGTQIEIAIPQ